MSELRIQREVSQERVRDIQVTTVCPELENRALLIHYVPVLEPPYYRVDTYPVLISYRSFFLMTELKL